MTRRKDDPDLKDTADKIISFSHRTLWMLLWTVAVTVGGTVLGYFNLNATANEALSLASKHEQILNYMACDVRQLKNYMIYGVRPRAGDQCTEESRR